MSNALCIAENFNTVWRKIRQDNRCIKDSEQALIDNMLVLLVLLQKYLEISAIFFIFEKIFYYCIAKLGEACYNKYDNIFLNKENTKKWKKTNQKRQCRCCWQPLARLF
ncbi:MAG: hypothetical protein FWH07_01895 [Oscillospiraceae bacterium]|nr:hypothetical protein [Oscillospiraceae bacterium]